MMSKIKIFIYIFLIMFSFLSKSNASYENLFYDFKIKSITGEIIDLSKFRGKTVLLVNVASNCGFTKQYSELQTLYEKYKENNFIVLGVPSNQFGGQEPGTNEEIKNFCETNFNITFPMTDKIKVKGDEAHPIYKWAKKNHGNSTVPKWNFHKILINKDGKIQDTYGSFIKPMSQKILKQLDKIL